MLSCTLHFPIRRALLRTALGASCRQRRSVALLCRIRQHCHNHHYPQSPPCSSFSSSPASAIYVQDPSNNDTSSSAASTTTRRRCWSLHELADIDCWNHPQMKEIVQNVAFRLKYQSSQLERLSEYLNQIEKEPLLLLAASAKTSSSPTNSGSRMARPYWWTHCQEAQLLQEIQTQQGQLRNLRRLYTDTNRQIQQYLDKQQAAAQAGQAANDKERYWLFKLFGEIYSRHALTIETYAELVIGLRPLQQPQGMHDLIQDILQERLGMLLLCDHITLVCSTKVTSSSPIAHVDITDTIQKASTEASHLCEAHYMISPNVELVRQDNTPTKEEEDGSSPLSLLLVKPWLQYALVELLKNSMSVTVERNRTLENSQQSEAEMMDAGDNNSSTTMDDSEREEQLCPIHIRIQETLDSVEIEIDDQGGGIDLDKLHKLFEFAQRQTKWDRMDEQTTYAMTRSPLQGLGVGLSMSRMMMEYFGGSLDLQDRPSKDDALLQPGVRATIVLPKNVKIREKISS